MELVNGKIGSCFMITSMKATRNEHEMNIGLFRTSEMHIVSIYSLVELP